MSINGNIKDFAINGYTYHNLITHGTLAKKQFDGILLVDDPNLALEFDGIFNFKIEFESSLMILFYSISLDN